MRERDPTWRRRWRYITIWSSIGSSMRGKGGCFLALVGRAYGGDVERGAQLFDFGKDEFGGKIPAKELAALDGSGRHHEIADVFRFS